MESLHGLTAQRHNAEDQRDLRSSGQRGRQRGREGRRGGRGGRGEDVSHPGSLLSSISSRAFLIVGIQIYEATVRFSCLQEMKSYRHLKEETEWRQTEKRFLRKFLERWEGDRRLG